ncbi:MAG: selenite/tellurite reduction operon c-type cytochrome ExtM [Thermoanaerobaculia bacterium]
MRPLQNHRVDPARLRAARTIAVLTLLAALLAGCARAASAGNESCGTCHAEIERASPTHAGCVSCHGGNGAATDEEGAHRGMHDALPAADRWDAACGTCHRDQVGRMTSSQMYTNAGMIAQIQATWEGDLSAAPLAAVDGEHFAPDGAPIALASVASTEDLSGELYRKFCSRCHLARANDDPDNPGHPGGCASCHFPFGDADTYQGEDDSVRGRGPHSATHAMQGLPPMSACERCHNRSGRIALSYRGLQDGNNALVPTRNGMPGPTAGSDGRSYTSIAPDVHFEAGMECIDCHTSREIMGDGYAHESMAGQLEIGCADCHGDAISPPRFVELTRESDAPIRESRQYARPLIPGMRVALTTRGRPFSNVFERGGDVFVVTKRGGKILRSAVITGTPAHTIAGHERMECTACHSRAVPQCYGCHTTYDKREDGWDFVRDEDSPGVFTESEDYRTLYPFPLAINGRGGIAPVTPGCQTFVTVIEADGSRSKEEAIARYGERPQLRFAPFYGHNTRPRAVGCEECHGNPAFLGFGQHLIEAGAIRSTMLCERNPQKGLDAFLSMDEGRVVSHAAIAREGARPLDHDEVRRTLAVNLCIVCHPRAEDPIYRKRLDYDALGDALHRRLLADLR